MVEINQIVICINCRETLEYKNHYAQEVLKKYPSEKSYTIKS
jgi:hypothetical protein